MGRATTIQLAFFLFFSSISVTDSFFHSCSSPPRRLTAGATRGTSSSTSASPFRHGFPTIPLLQESRSSVAYLFFQPEKSAFNNMNGDAHDSDLPSITVSTVDYTRMELPERSKANTHAIYGNLLRENCIESYHVYKHRSVNKETVDGEIVLSIVQLGTHVDGHPGIVHGGILGLLIDDVLGFGFEALEIPMAVTANLNIDYRSAVQAGQSIRIRCYLQERKVRKLVWKVDVTSVENDTLLCEATSVYVIPRHVLEAN